MNVKDMESLLERASVSFAPGLSDNEVTGIEQRYHFRFPPDLKEFLMFALPVSKGFPNWRDIPEDTTRPNPVRAAMGKTIRERLDWPYEGICFDIEENAFWLPEWGSRPDTSSEACQIAKVAIERAPVLIPIYSHRYIPDRPHESGNPVFSVYQTDIIYYGSDLGNYLEHEFFTRRSSIEYANIKCIDFWSRLVELNG